MVYEYGRTLTSPFVNLRGALVGGGLSIVR